MHMNLQKILIYLNKKDENVLSQLMSDIFSVTYFQNADEAHRYFERGRDVCGESDFSEGKLLITDDLHVYTGAKQLGIAGVQYLDDYSRLASFVGARYCVDDLSVLLPEDLERIYMRYHGIPWTICETKRLIIREQTMEDIDALYEIYSNPVVTKYTEGLYKIRAREEEYMRRYIDYQYAFFEYGVWGIVRKSDGKLIGRAGLSDRAEETLTELGYVLDPAVWHNGYAYEACDAIVSYAHDQLQLKKMCAYSMAENKASVALLLKLGFTHDRMTVLDGKKYERYLKKF